MAWIFGSQRTNTPDPVAVGLRVQSSLQGVAIPIGCGRARWSGNLIDYAGFVATPQKSPGSKGGFGSAAGKGNTGQYNYSVSGLVSLGEGGVLAFNRIHNGNNIDFLIAPTALELTDLNNIGINPTNITTGNNTYHAIYHYGNWTDAPDSWWTSNYPSLTPLAYPGQAYVEFPNLGLGSSPSFPSFSFDCTWTLSSDISALGPDANPSDWINAFLTNADWGVQGFPSSAIGDFATAKNYWRANGMMVSVALTSQTAAQSHLKELIDSLNADFRWSNGKLDIVPYGDVAVTGNGYTYTPNTTPIYNLGVNDFLPNQGSLGNAATSDKVKVSHSRADASQIPNIFQVEYLDRINLYNPVTIYHSNDANITISGKRRYGDKKSQHWFCLAGAASVACALQLHRAWTTLNTYQWTVGRQFILLDVLDIVTITEPALQLSNQLVRLTEIQENSDGTLTMTAEEVPLTASAPVYARQQSTGIARNNAIVPGSVNTPVIFELPGQVSQALQVQIAVSGSVPSTWGGCTVWVSTDGTNYQQAGQITTPSRMGVLTASLASVSTSPSGPTLDTTNTLAVNLTESAGVLYSGSAADLAALATLCLVDNELIAYQTATLTGANAYNLTTLERGCYGTQASVTTHAIGASFVRVDDTIFRWGYTNALIGQTLCFKFTSFNSYGSNEESLAAVTAYSHTLSGTPTPSGVAITSATLTQVGVANTLAVAWTADPLAVSYVLDYSTNGGSAYTAVAVPNVLAWKIEGLQVTDVYVRIAGVSANGVQGPYLTPTHITGATINYAGALAINYNDLTSSAMQQQLDAIANEEAGILGDISSALTANQITVNAIRSANSAISVTNYVQSTALSAVAAQVTQVSAQASEASANGQVAFVASAAPAGAYAAWSLQVTATGYATSAASMTVSANSDGTSGIYMRADQFNLTLPGFGPQPVMQVADVNGVATLSFNGNVVADGSVLNPSYQNGSLGHSGVIQAVGFASTSGNLTITVFGRSPVLVFVTTDTFENQTSTFNCVLSISANGVTIASKNLFATGTSGSWECYGTATMLSYIPAGAGNVTFSASISNTNFATDQGTSQYITLAVIELGA